MIYQVSYLSKKIGKFAFRYEPKEKNNFTGHQVSEWYVLFLFRSYIKSEAVLKIMKYIDLPFPQLAFFFQFAPL